MKYTISFLFLLIFLTAGCTERRESPTKGTVTVYCDDSVFPLVSQLADSFNILYPEALVTVLKVSGKEAVARLVNKESELSISSRLITQFEDSVIAVNKIEYRTLKFVVDGVVLIANFSFENKISFDMMKDVIYGKSKKYTAVLPDNSSAVTEYLQYEKFRNEPDLKYITASDETDVVNQVLSNSNYIGFINHITAETLSVVKKIEIGAEKQTRAETYYYPPHPGFYLQELYPLSRPVYIYLAEINIGTASGFATFLTGNIGQKLALEKNFGPAAVPVRIRE